MIVDLSARIVLVNSHTERLFGCDRGELISQTVEALVPERHRAGQSANRSLSLAHAGRPTTLAGAEFHGLRKQGAEFPIEITSCPLQTEEGTMVMNAVRDITERRKADRKFRDLLESAPDAIVIVDSWESEFLANVSHELRPPLNGIIVFSEFLYDEKPGPLNGPGCRGDPILLEQVVLNLLDNALKYTRTQARSSIEIGALCKDGQYTFHVKDNGVGFDMRYADKLFAAFQRLHPSSEFSGTGVGLAVVRRAIEKHGGRCRAQSEPDRGATFFSLPCETGNE